MRSGASSEKKDEARNKPGPDPGKGDVYVLRCIDAKSKLRIASHLSKTIWSKDAEALLRKVRSRLGHMRVLFTSDKLRGHTAAFRRVFGTTKTGKDGEPVTVYPKGLMYAQIDKERKSGHLKAVDRKVVIGTMDGVKRRLRRDKLSEVINTSYIERDNLSMRQHNGRLVRKTLSYSKLWPMHQHSVDFEDVMHNFVRPHLALREYLDQPYGRHKWRESTPAMAAGITDHVWSLEEFAQYRLPSRI
jgi:hypothetical protein